MNNQLAIRAKVKAEAEAKGAWYINVDSANRNTVLQFFKKEYNFTAPNDTVIIGFYHRANSAITIPHCISKTYLKYSTFFKYGNNEFMCGFGKELSYADFLNKLEKQSKMKIELNTKEKARAKGAWHITINNVNRNTVLRFFKAKHNYEAPDDIAIIGFYYCDDFTSIDFNTIIPCGISRTALRNCSKEIIAGFGDELSYRDFLNIFSADIDKLEKQNTESVNSDAVNHPTHYGGSDNPYEAIKVIEAWKLNFNLGNVVKYISRAGKKDSKVQDLEKAVWYLNRELKNLKDAGLR